MNFEIRRASDWQTKDAPCEGAIKKNDGWFIEIKDLEHLIAFKQQYGDLIIQDRFNQEGTLIYIYDDYME